MENILSSLKKRATAATGTVTEKAARPSASRQARLWFSLLMLLCAAYAGRHWIIYDGYVPATRDESMFLPVILKNSTPALYARDYSVNNFHLASGVFLDFSSAWLKLAGGNLRVFLLGASTALLFIFIAGVFFLVRHLTGNPAASLLAGLLLMRPRPATAGTGFAVYVGNYQARTFIDALTPWFFLGYFKSGSAAGKLLLGCLLGAVSWFYPVYPAQLAALFALLSLLQGRVRDAVALSAGFAVIFAPYYFQAIVHGAGPLTPEAVRIVIGRWGNQVYPQVWGLISEFLWYFSLPLALFLVSGGARKAEGESGDMRTFRLAGLAAAALIAASFLSYAFPVLLPLMLQRLGRLYHLIFLVCGAAGAVVLFSKEGRPALKAACLALVLLNLAVIDPRSLFEDFYPGLSANVSAPEKGELLALAALARKSTPVDSIFMVPPDGFNNFSLYSERGIVVAFKTTSAVNDSRVLEYWKTAYDKARAAYAGGDFSKLKALARNYGADYVLVASGTFKTDEKPVMEAGSLKIYTLGGLDAAARR